MIYTQAHHNAICEAKDTFEAIAQNILWITEGNPQMKVEYELLMTLIGQDYNTIRENIMPFVFKEDESFLEDVLSMYNKVLEAEVDMVYEDIMSSIEIDYNEETNSFTVRQWDRE